MGLGELQDETNFNLPSEQTPLVAPLLVMVYEFERGHGTMDVSIISNNNSYLDQTADGANDMKVEI